MNMPKILVAQYPDHAILLLGEKHIGQGQPEMSVAQYPDHAVLQGEKHIGLRQPEKTS